MFKKRTRNVALRVIKLVNALPNSRAACRSRSTADMVSRLSITEEEADEALYWLELLAQSNTIASPGLEPIRKEIGEIVAMTDTSIKTLRSRPIQNPKSKI